MRLFHPAYTTARYNMLVPPCAAQTKIEGNHLYYLHPRKGWKKVSLKRLGAM